MGITVLSLFDGISCGQIALERAGIKVDRYYASEIKKCAIETTMRNYPAGNCTNITKAEKIGCLTRKQDRCPNSGLIECGGFCRYLTRREIGLAQTLPIGYTDNLSYSQMQDVCGDGWTVEVIAHIFSFLKKEIEEM